MGGEDWRVAIAAAKSSTTLRLETSGSLDRAKISAAIEALGAHRLLYGSGSPHLDPAAALGLLDDSGLSDDTRRRLLSLNALRLFNLERQPATTPEPAIGAAPSSPQ
jgi:predicted TIM-barrel fold metal-dependent hydrolase